jgi:hypothetical protein
MNDFLEKYWPLLAAAAVVVVALAMANKISTTNLPGKGLQFKKVSKIPIAAMDKHSKPSIGLLVDGEPATAPYLTTAVIKNTGNIPISEDDYETPINVVVQNDATIVQMRCLYDPPEIHTEVTHSPKELAIAPTLMNPGDMVILQVFTQGGEPDFSIEGRIEGIEKIYTEEGWGGRRWNSASGLGYVFFLLSLFGVMLLAVIMKLSYQSRYVFISRTSGVILYAALCATSLYLYFGLIVDHASPIYTSSLLLLGSAVIAFLLAWLTIRGTERE